MITKTAKPLQRERQLFCALSILVCGLLALYMYFVSAAIAHVVVRKELNQEIAAMHTRISDFEAEYIIEKDRIAEPQAIELGFERNENKIFVTKKSAVALSRTNEN